MIYYFMVEFKNPLNPPNVITSRFATKEYDDGSQLEMWVIGLEEWIPWTGHLNHTVKKVTLLTNDEFEQFTFLAAV